VSRMLPDRHFRLAGAAGHRGRVICNQNSLRTDGIDIDLRGNVEIGNYGKWISDLSVTKYSASRSGFPDRNEQSIRRYGGALYFVLRRGHAPLSRDLVKFLGHGTVSSRCRRTMSAVSRDGRPMPPAPTPRACTTTTTVHVASFIDNDFTGIYKDPMTT